MRYIKFRAWDPETKEMITDFDQNIKRLKIGQSIHLLVYETGLMYKTLTQYTGLKDKTGAEIYEGDILESATGTSRYVVIWEHSGWFRKPIKGEWRRMSLYVGSKSQKVIGNIYENPELLT